MKYMQHHSEHYPYTGGKASADLRVPESDGLPGEKEAMPATMASMKSDDGYHDTGAQQEHAMYHSNPAVMAHPDNISGPIESDNPTKGEGSGGPQDYPHAGPPARTWTTGEG